MVITGVADRIPDRVDSLVFLDAVVPRDGEACWDLVNDEERQWYVEVDDSGFGVAPMPFFDDRATSHPLATVLQPLRLRGDLNGFRQRIFVYALDWPGSHRCGRPTTGCVTTPPGSVTNSTAGTI